MDNLIS